MQRSKNFPGGETPGPPLQGAAASNAAGRGRLTRGGGEGEGGRGGGWEGKGRGGKGRERGRRGEGEGKERGGEGVVVPPTFKTLAAPLLMTEMCHKGGNLHNQVWKKPRQQLLILPCRQLALNGCGEEI